MEMKDIQLEVIYIVATASSFLHKFNKADTYIVKERRGEEKGVYVERRVSREEMVRYGGGGGGCG
jgi:hypothetical protein